jgi:hypothetical protein
MRLLARYGTLIPQPLLPQEKERKPHINFLFSCPTGEGLGVRALQNPTESISTTKVKNY